jgi:hypothetical protein
MTHLTVDTRWPFVSFDLPAMTDVRHGDETTVARRRLAPACG